MRSTARALFGLGALALLASSPGHAADYAVGAFDKIRITVSDWNPTAADFRTRIDGIFTVDPGGSLSLPLIGTVPVAGVDAAKVAGLVGERFATLVGAIQPPITSAEVVEYRPFYVVGVVDRPGPYQFRPGFTVLHAISMAGGLFRRQDADLSRFRRDSLAAEGDLRAVGAAADGLQIRKARLEAELAGSALTIPESLSPRQAEEYIGRLIEQENGIMASRRDAMASQLASLKSERALLDDQLKQLRAQEEALAKQLAVAQRELATQKDIVDRSLAPVVRLFPIETRVADAEAKKRQLQADLLKTSQDLVRLDQTLRSAPEQRRSEILAEIKDTETKLQEARHRLSTAQAQGQSADLALARDSGEGHPSFSILRDEGSGLEERPATETTLVRPGDILRVRLEKGPASSAGLDQTRLASTRTDGTAR
jgi:polysaccharide export outer membrane protein/exopolysaccharide production protein ExoF